MKAKSNGKAGRPVKYSSITKLVKETLKSAEDVSYVIIEKRVRAHFPKSKFNERHFSWYKCAFHQRKLKGVR